MANKDRNKPATTVSPFSLKIGSEFGARADDVFGSLGNIEAKHQAFEKVRSKSHEGERGPPKDDPRGLRPDGGSKHSQDQAWSSQRHQSQDFKRPHAPPPRKRESGKCHDPSKWTYYNLGDVSADDMSDRSNIAAALSFLQSRKAENANKKQKTGHSESMDVDSVSDSGQQGPVKHLFKKSLVKREDSDAAKKTPSQIQIAGRPGCVVMPEYVIGKKSSKSKLKSTKMASKEKPAFSQVSMGHLFDNDDVEDDTGDDVVTVPTKVKPKQPSDIGVGLEGNRSSGSSRQVVLGSAKAPTLFSDCLRDDDDRDMRDTDQSHSRVKFRSQTNKRQSRRTVAQVDDDSNSSHEAEESSSTKDLDLDGVD